MTLHDSPPSRSDPETLYPSSLEEPVGVDRPQHRLYIDESGDHTFHLADNDNHRHLGLLGIWFDTGQPYRVFVQALNDLKADIFGWDPDDPPICLHRKDIIERRKIFGRLRDPELNRRFETGLLGVIHEDAWAPGRLSPVLWLARVMVVSSASDPKGSLTQCHSAVTLRQPYYDYMEDCFLCKPDSELVFVEDQDHFALAGLGPIVPGYSVIGVRRHIRSSADLTHVEFTRLVSFLSMVRDRLSSEFGSCVVAEHGRIPVCFRQAGLSESHCYHAHFLLFPGAPIVDGLALPYFDNVKLFSNMEQALSDAAGSHQDYYLLSSRPDNFLVLREARAQIRQFSRAVVATAVGAPQLIDWQSNPNREEALATAIKLKRLFGATGD